MQSIPNPDEVKSLLDPLLRTIFRALDVAIIQTRDFFDKESDGVVDLSLAPNLVRYRVKRELTRAGQEVSDDDGTDEFGLERLANNGLALKYQDFTIRILKLDNGAIPAPGLSRVKRNFYHQQFELKFNPEDMLERSSLQSLNLLLLWDVTREYVFRGLSLACPKSGDSRRGSVEDYWHVPIAHPALTRDAFAKEKDPTAAASEMDLPIFRKTDDSKEAGRKDG